MIIEVRHLRLVDAIRREGSISRAARQLNLTQPAVSHALRELEDRLGVPLFNRGHKRMAPTPEGERLLRTSDTVLRELRNAEYELEQFRLGFQGVIRLATKCYTCYNWLPGVLGKFGKRYPDIRIEIVPEVKRDPLAAVREKQLDLAIVDQLPNEADVEAVRLFDDELVTIMAPDHPLAGCRVLEAQHFADQHLISQTPLVESSLNLQVLAPAGVTPQKVSIIPLTEAVIQAAQQGLGIATMARWLAAPEIELGRIAAVRVTKKGLKRTWYAATLTGRIRSKSPPLGDLVRELKRSGYRSARECRIV